MTSRTPTTGSLGALPVGQGEDQQSSRGDGMRRLSRGSWIIAGLVLLLLLSAAGRYGFHRDELYFIEGGHHLSWAQPDNPITVPLVAAAWHSLVGGQLALFRIIPAVLAAACVLIAATTARLVGGSALHQTVTAGLMASTSILLATGHLFSTTTFDLVLTSTVIMLLIRAVQEPAELRRWVAVGLVAGLALEIKILPAMILVSCLAGIVTMGPRHVLRRNGPWLAMLIAAVIAAPNLIWQTVHAWPMLEVAGNIAAGGSTSSSERYLVLPMHLLMAGPAAAIVIIIGLIASFRSPALRPYRWVPVAYLVMLALVVATGAKPYYLAGFFVAVLALGGGAVDHLPRPPAPALGSGGDRGRGAGGADRHFRPADCPGRLARVPGRRVGQSGPGRDRGLGSVGTCRPASRGRHRHRRHSRDHPKLWRGRSPQPGTAPQPPVGPAAGLLRAQRLRRVGTTAGGGVERNRRGPLQR